MLSDKAQRYWDRRARENALYFVDNQLDYRNPDPEAFWRGGEEVVDLILNSVGVRISSSDEIVDIGCGVGRLTRALAARSRKVIGLDVSPEMLARARQLNPGLRNVDWLQGDGRSLEPIVSGSVDGCFSHVVFQHIPDPAVTLNYVREMGRVLRPGGWTIFVLSTDPKIHKQRPTLHQRARSVIGLAPRGGDHRAWLGSPVDEARLRQAADGSGLEIKSLLAPGTQFTTVHAVRNDAPRETSS